MDSGFHARLKKKRVSSTGKGWRTPKGSGSIYPPTIHPFSHFQVVKGLLGARLYWHAEKWTQNVWSLWFVSRGHTVNVQCEAHLLVLWGKVDLCRQSGSAIERGSSGGALCQVELWHQSQPIRFGWWLGTMQSLSEEAGAEPSWFPCSHLRAC